MDDSGVGGIAGPTGEGDRTERTAWPGAGEAWTPPAGAPAAGGAPYAGAGPAAGAGQPWTQPPGAQAPGAQPFAAANSAQARLATARAAGQRAVRNGVLWILAGVAITLGTFLVAPGGFFIVSFGPVIVGINQISRGRAHLAKVAAAERQLFGQANRP